MKISTVLSVCKLVMWKACLSSVLTQTSFFNLHPMFGPVDMNSFDNFIEPLTTIKAHVLLTLQKAHLTNIFLQRGVYE